ncbi:MAG TPA: hypothetical protein VLF71_04645 [Candidatus Saccharimonadales bacterium]|nr:hypothetical protein [Candidatus Saccharimonadales bacterium]
MQPSKTSKKRELVAALAVFIVIAAIVGTATVSAKKRASVASTANINTASTNSGAGTPTTPSATAAGTATPTASMAGATGTSQNTSSTYKDGSYTAVGSYYSPDGPETISVAVTLKGGVITDTSANSGGGSHDSLEYQQRFIAGYRQVVVGKAIDSVNVSRVSGASLTPQGFNDAIDQIKQQAKNT